MRPIILSAVFCLVGSAVIGQSDLSLLGSQSAGAAAVAPAVPAGDALSAHLVARGLLLPATAPASIVGHVLAPDGGPAERAVVVSSAGGQAITDAAGAFTLDIVLPAGTNRVQLTVVLGSQTGSLIGSVLVDGLAPFGTASAATVILAQSSSCQPEWLPMFGGDAGLDSSVSALVTFDDGSGPALYVGGRFSAAGGVAVNNIAKWDGKAWSALGLGLDDLVTALTVFDDGSGPALYAGGWFNTAGGLFAPHVAKWDGTNWSSLDQGVGTFIDAVWTLQAFDDGTGRKLYAGGTFDVPAAYIAKWNGVNWSAVGATLNGNVLALTTFDDGAGPALFAGGYFSSAGVIPVNYIAKWNGTSWSAVGGGADAGVFAFNVFHDGDRPVLGVGGQFSNVGGVAARYIATWNGKNWLALGSGLNGWVKALASFNDGNGPDLYAGGDFTTAGGVAANHVAKWDGTTWSPLGGGMNGSVSAMATLDEEDGVALFAGGEFTTAGRVDANNIAKWDCPAASGPWTDLGFALSGVNGDPQLVGNGPLTTDSAGTLTLSSAAASASSMLFVSLSSVRAPFKGGTLVPVPSSLELSLVTDGSGSIPLSWVRWPDGLSGMSIYIQYAIQDAAAVQGVALSNALRADVP